MISVLFVDDEPNLRADLQRMFRSRRDRWSMSFASSGAQALEMLRMEPVDVVVSDMQMPGMNGAELLARIRRDYPETILIILSGQCDRRTALRTIEPAHLYMAKPCEPAELVNTVERAHRLRSLLSKPRPGDARDGGESPSYPELAQMLRDPDVAFETVAFLIEQDQNLTTKILQLVNAAFFGASWRVRSPLQALKLLGLDLVRSLVLDIARLAPSLPHTSNDLTIGGSLSAEQPSETGIAIVVADRELRVRFVNDSYCRKAGHGFDDLIGRPCRLLDGPNADPQVLKFVAEVHDVRTTVSRTDLAPGFDLSVTPLLDGSSTLAYYLCTQTELGVDDAARGSAKGPEPAIAFDELSEGLIVLDRDGYIVAVNPAFEGVFNYSPAEAVGQSLDFLNSPLHGREFYAERERATDQAGYWRGEAWHCLRNGLSIPHLVTISVVHDGNMENRHYVVTFRTVLKKRDLERLRFLSNRDALTGLPNRTSFTEEVAAAVERAGLSKGGLAILAIHFDRFKLASDSLGSKAGDRILRMQAARLLDYIGERGLAGGAGRGEFLLLVDDLEHEEGADTIVKEVAAALSLPIVIDGHEVSTNVSIGFSCFPSDGVDAARLIGNAQAALCEPAEGGSGLHRRFERERNVHSIARFTIGNQLCAAIERGELELHYQPKISSETGVITGLEALVRWHHPEEGLVAPARFIPVAEETRLIEAIGEWVLKTACVQMRSWQEEGIAPGRMAVNLSPHQFRQSDLLDRIQAALTDAGLSPSSFEVEITEGSTMNDPEAAIRLMQALRDMGVSISIDDFGTGYSSLTYLKRFPINAIKIDQSFVRGLPHDLNDVAICEAVIGLARTLRLGLIAEGVETLEQRTFLVDRGCDEMQGYLFSRPCSAVDIEPFLRRDAVDAFNALNLASAAQRIPIPEMV